ncbi:LOW QUALITY PROTEIN: cell surface glycoprotein CD200 receptor 1 [Emydura macquarii macquarii]|uniref:LOW QUALITY PROTEIN: cell surface glycoprotein CD200 receptor 1 n=1 Tax=Emydura macquarii macquarii TaxID=1129001 RepID=UPI00352B7D33
MKAKADMNFVGKTFCAFILLTISVAMVTMDNIGIFKIAGSSVHLTSHKISGKNLVSVIWKIGTNGTHCLLSYSAHDNITFRNCSERMDWKCSPDTDCALQIQKVTLNDEGCYICETVDNEGTFIQNYHLTVLVPPEVTLTCNSNLTAVCKAAAGKPAAWISWDPNGDARNQSETHTNGTKTVLSTYTISSPKETNITCVVSHLAGNISQSKECPSENGNTFLQFLWYFATSASLLGILFILAFIFFCKVHRGRICYKPKSPETAPTHNMQDSNEQRELEPYASYIQKENVIYNTVYDVAMSENLPPGLQSAT